jgi:hypothetical protein
MNSEQCHVSRGHSASQLPGRYITLMMDGRSVQSTSSSASSHGPPSGKHISVQRSGACSYPMKDSPAACLSQSATAALVVSNRGTTWDPGTLGPWDLVVLTANITASQHHPQSDHLADHIIDLDNDSDSSTGLPSLESIIANTPSKETKSQQSKNNGMRGTWSV